MAGLVGDHRDDGLFDLVFRGLAGAHGLESLRTLTGQAVTQEPHWTQAAVSSRTLQSCWYTCAPTGQTDTQAPQCRQFSSSLTMASPSFVTSTWLFPQEVHDRAAALVGHVDHDLARRAVHPGALDVDLDSRFQDGVREDGLPDDVRVEAA